MDIKQFNSPIIIGGMILTKNRNYEQTSTIAIDNFVYKCTRF